MAVGGGDGRLVRRCCSAAWRGVTLAGGPTDCPVSGQASVGVGSTDEQVAAAREAVRGLIAFYASTPAYRPVLDAHGWGELQPRLRDLTRAGDWAALPGLVTDEVVETIAIVGAPAAVAEKLQGRFARCERVALSAPYALDLGALAELVALAR